MNKGLRAVAAFTLFFFLTTQCVSAAPGAGIEMAGQRELPSYLSIDIPAELGTVDALYEAPAGANPQFILHIQNAHANYQAQMKIKQLLGYMNKKYGFKTIFVEGASEKLDPDYLRLFPDQERNLKLCDELAKQGELTGAELYMMEADKNIEALGIEQASLYKANYEALKIVFGAETDVTRFFKGFDTKLDRVASKTFTPETRELIADWKRFEQGRRDFMPFVKSLTVKSKKILNVDLESLFAQVGWPQISRLLVIQQLEKEMNKAKGQEEQAKLINWLRGKGVSKELLATLENFNEGSIAVGKSATEVSPREVLERLAAEAGPKGFKFSDYPAFSLFAGYVTLRSELDPKVLFEEIEYLFTQMLDTLAKEPQQKALLALYRDGELLRKLLHLELNRTQWRQAVAAKDRIAVPSLVSRLKDAVIASGDVAVQKDQQVMPKAFSGKMDELFTAGLEFYDFAHQREAIFYKQMQTAMTDRKITKAILITGGFHTDGMSDLFRENAISYGIVTPRLSEKSNENLYRTAMLQDRGHLFSISYLEMISKMLKINILENNGVNPGKLYAGLIAVMSEVGQSSLPKSVAEFNASPSANKNGIVLAMQVNAKGEILKSADGLPVYKIVNRGDVSRVEVPLEAGQIASDLQGVSGQIIPTVPAITTPIVVTTSAVTVNREVAREFWGETRETLPVALGDGKGWGDLSEDVLQSMERYRADLLALREGFPDVVDVKADGRIRQGVFNVVRRNYGNLSPEKISMLKDAIYNDLNAQLELLSRSEARIVLDDKFVQAWKNAEEGDWLLILEDNQMFRDIYAGKLNKAGRKVTMVENVPAAIAELKKKVAKEGRPYILTDNSMPGGPTGKEFVAALKAKDISTGRIVMMTNAAENELVSIGHELGIPVLDKGSVDRVVAAVDAVKKGPRSEVRVKVSDLITRFQTLADQPGERTESGMRLPSLRPMWLAAVEYLTGLKDEEIDPRAEWKQLALKASPVLGWNAELRPASAEAVQASTVMLAFSQYLLSTGQFIDLINEQPARSEVRITVADAIASVKTLQASLPDSLSPQQAKPVAQFRAVSLTDLKGRDIPIGEPVAVAQQIETLAREINSRTINRQPVNAITVIRQLGAIAEQLRQSTRSETRAQLEPVARQAAPRGLLGAVSALFLAATSTAQAGVNRGAEVFPGWPSLDQPVKQMMQKPTVGAFAGGAIGFIIGNFLTLAFPKVSNKFMVQAGSTAVGALIGYAVVPVMNAVNSTRAAVSEFQPSALTSAISDPFVVLLLVVVAVIAAVWGSYEAWAQGVFDGVIGWFSDLLDRRGRPTAPSIQPQRVTVTPSRVMVRPAQPAMKRITEEIEVQDITDPRELVVKMGDNQYAVIANPRTGPDIARDRVSGPNNGYFKTEREALAAAAKVIGLAVDLDQSIKGRETALPVAPLRLELLSSPDGSVYFVVEIEPIRGTKKDVLIRAKTSKGQIIKELILTRGSSKTRSSITIGRSLSRRSPSSEIQILGDMGISRTHLTIEFTEKGLEVLDGDGVTPSTFGVRAVPARSETRGLLRTVADIGAMVALGVVLVFGAMSAFRQSGQSGFYPSIELIAPVAGPSADVLMDQNWDAAVRFFYDEWRRKNNRAGSPDDVTAFAQVFMSLLKDEADASGLPNEGAYEDLMNLNKISSLSENLKTLAMERAALVLQGKSVAAMDEEISQNLFDLEQASTARFSPTDAREKFNRAIQEARATFGSNPAARQNALESLNAAWDAYSQPVGRSELRAWKIAAAVVALSLSSVFAALANDMTNFVVHLSLGRVTDRGLPIEITGVYRGANDALVGTAGADIQASTNLAAANSFKPIITSGANGSPITNLLVGARYDKNVPFALTVFDSSFKNASFKAYRMMFNGLTPTNFPVTGKSLAPQTQTISTFMPVSEGVNVSAVEMDGPALTNAINEAVARKQLPANMILTADGNSLRINISVPQADFGNPVERRVIVDTVFGLAFGRVNGQLYLAHQHSATGLPMLARWDDSKIPADLKAGETRELGQAMAITLEELQAEAPDVAEQFAAKGLVRSEVRGINEVALRERLNAIRLDREAVEDVVKLVKARQDAVAIGETISGKYGLNAVQQRTLIRQIILSQARSETRLTEQDRETIRMALEGVSLQVELDDQLRLIASVLLTEMPRLSDEKLIEALRALNTRLPAYDYATFAGPRLSDPFLPIKTILLNYGANAGQPARSELRGKEPNMVEATAIMLAMMGVFSLVMVPLSNTAASVEGMKWVAFQFYRHEWLSMSGGALGLSGVLFFVNYVAKVIKATIQSRKSFVPQPSQPELSAQILDMTAQVDNGIRQLQGPVGYDEAVATRLLSLLDQIEIMNTSVSDVTLRETTLAKVIVDGDTIINLMPKGRSETRIFTIMPELQGPGKLTAQVLKRFGYFLINSAGKGTDFQTGDSIIRTCLDTLKKEGVIEKVDDADVRTVDFILHNLEFVPPTTDGGTTQISYLGRVIATMSRSETRTINKLVDVISVAAPVVIAFASVVIAAVSGFFLGMTGPYVLAMFGLVTLMAYISSASRLLAPVIRPIVVGIDRMLHPEIYRAREKARRDDAAFGPGSRFESPASPARIEVVQPAIIPTIKMLTDLQQEIAKDLTDLEGLSAVDPKVPDLIRNLNMAIGSLDRTELQAEQAGQLQVTRFAPTYQRKLEALLSRSEVRDLKNELREVEAGIRQALLAPRDIFQHKLNDGIASLMSEIGEAGRLDLEPIISSKGRPRGVLVRFAFRNDDGVDRSSEIVSAKQYLAAVIDSLNRADYEVRMDPKELTAGFSRSVSGFTTVEIRIIPQVRSEVRETAGLKKGEQAKAPEVSSAILGVFQASVVSLQPGAENTARFNALAKAMNGEEFRRTFFQRGREVSAVASKDQARIKDLFSSFSEKMKSAIFVAVSSQGGDSRWNIDGTLRSEVRELKALESPETIKNVIIRLDFAMAEAKGKLDAFGELFGELRAAVVRKNTAGIMRANDLLEKNIIQLRDPRVLREDDPLRGLLSTLHSQLAMVQGMLELPQRSELRDVKVATAPAKAEPLIIAAVRLDIAHGLLEKNRSFILDASGFFDNEKYLSFSKSILEAKETIEALSGTAADAGAISREIARLVALTTAMEAIQPKIDTQYYEQHEAIQNFKDPLMQVVKDLEAWERDNRSEVRSTVEQYQALAKEVWGLLSADVKEKLENRHFKYDDKSLAGVLGQIILPASLKVLTAKDVAAMLTTLVSLKAGEFNNAMFIESAKDILNNPVVAISDSPGGVVSVSAQKTTRRMLEQLFTQLFLNTGALVRRVVETADPAEIKDLKALEADIKSREDIKNQSIGDRFELVFVAPGKGRLESEINTQVLKLAKALGATAKSGEGLRVVFLNEGVEALAEMSVNATQLYSDESLEELAPARSLTAIKASQQPKLSVTSAVATIPEELSKELPNVLVPRTDKGRFDINNKVLKGLGLTHLMEAIMTRMATAKSA